MPPRRSRTPGGKRPVRAARRERRRGGVRLLRRGLTSGALATSGSTGSSRRRRRSWSHVRAGRRSAGSRCGTTRCRRCAPCGVRGGGLDAHVAGRPRHHAADGDNAVRLLDLQFERYGHGLERQRARSGRPVGPPEPRTTCGVARSESCSNSASSSSRRLVEKAARALSATSSGGLSTSSAMRRRRCISSSSAVIDRGPS